MPRNRGIKLPDAGDVQQVGFANDPGVNVPNLGIDIGAFDVSAATDAIQRAAAKQQKLLDATKTAEAYEAFGRTTMDDFNRRRLEEDSSDPEFLKSFQGFLDQNVETALTNLPEGVSEEAKAGLRMRLSSQRNAFLDSAGQVHLGALQDKAGATIESQINTWSAQASRDPALLDGILDLADEGLGQFAGALPTAAEQKYRQAARSSIVESAVSGLVDLGGLKEARALLGDERFNADLDPNRRAVLGNRIDAEQKRREAEAKAAAREQRAMFLADFRMQLEDEEAARARGTSTGLTDDTIRKALSIDQAGAKLAERTIASLNASQQLSLDMTEMALMPPEEQNELVASYAPVGGTQFVAGAEPEGMIEPGTIDITKRPQVKNEDGSISTVRSISFNLDGQEVLIPTVIGDRIVSNQEAIKHYRQTGEHLGKFDTPEHATAYADTLHNQQATQFQKGGFADQAKRFDQLQNAREQLNAALVKDPVGYILQFNKSARAAYEGMGDPDPAKRAEATSRYATIMESEQIRLGLTPEQVRLLNSNHAEQIAAQFSNQQEGGQGAAELSASLAAQWGDRWPQVYGELAPKLPTAAVVIGSGMAPGPAAALAEAARDPKALRDAVPTDTAKDVREAVATQLAPFAATVIGIPGGTNTLGVWSENTELLALQYVAKGDDATTAATKAAAETVNRNYTFEDTYRVPIAHDKDDIALGANRALAELLTTGSVDLPTSLTGLPEADTKQQYLRALQNKAYWVTDPEGERGLVLYDETGAAVTVNGKPYLKTWDELLSMQPRGAFSRELEAQ